MAKGASIGEIRKKVTKIYELILASFHEAGHTIYALLCGMKVNSVYVFEHKTLKRVHGITDYSSWVLEENSPIFATLLEQEIGLSYAGLIAEKHHFKTISGSDQIPMFIKEGSSDDFLSVRKLMKQYNPVPPGKKRTVYKQKIIRQTLSLLIQNWDAIDLVSHALFKHKRLSFQDLRDLLTKKSSNKKLWKEQFKLFD
jgi:hypothetical protein